MFDEMLREFFDGLGRILFGQDVNGVLDRVGWKNFAVVARGMHLIKVALKQNLESQLLDFVVALLAREAQHADARLSVIILAQTYAHQSAPAIGGVAVRAHEQWNVIVLACVDYGKGDFDEWIESRRLARREIRAGFKAQAVVSGGQLFGRQKVGQAAVLRGDASRNFFPFRAGRL